MPDGSAVNRISADTTPDAGTLPRGTILLLVTIPGERLAPNVLHWSPSVSRACPATRGRCRYAVVPGVHLPTSLTSPPVFDSLPRYSGTSYTWVPSSRSCATKAFDA